MGFSHAFLNFSILAQSKNNAQIPTANTVIFTIDKSAKKCGAALNYIIFLKGAAS